MSHSNQPPARHFPSAREQAAWLRFQPEHRRLRRVGILVVDIMVVALATLGALFLRRFVTTSVWAHFDVYAWAPKEKPARPQGGEAQALRASWRVLMGRFGEKTQSK